MYQLYNVINKSANKTNYKQNYAMSGIKTSQALPVSSLLLQTDALRASSEVRKER